ncbi:MAG: hypothetical protein RL235_1021 [Chlamydiota bacterium]|jgi:apolipoprotein N-acyltransferase
MNSIASSIGISALLVAFGLPTWCPYLGVMVSAFGFALFWRALLRCDRRFWVATLWYAFVQAIQISWMLSTDYMGPAIIIVYLLLTFAIGLQFGLLSAWIKPGGPIGIVQAFAMGGFWVAMEWMRTLPFNGFAWNPTGLALADTRWAVQFAAVVGMYGLSFWVIVSNVFALRAMQSMRKVTIAAWIAVVVTPYVIGGVNHWFCCRLIEKAPSVHALLIQTAILPEQRDFVRAYKDQYILPIDQWRRIVDLLPAPGESIDLIVLPEASLAGGAFSFVYSLDEVKELLQDILKLPTPKKPLAGWDKTRGQWRVTNAYVAQAIADAYGAHVISGFHVVDKAGQYNAALHFSPGEKVPKRYAKRILVPMGEYTPFARVEGFSEWLQQSFHLGASFDVGIAPVLFHANGAVPLRMGISICVEETHSHLIHDLKKMGANLFVNVTNDVWFPASRLPEQHYHIARVRAVENGVSLVRACNTGVTGAVDPSGKTIATLAVSESQPQALSVSVPIVSHATLYTWWGDTAIFVLSAFWIGLYFLKRLLRNSWLS